MAAVKHITRVIHAKVLAGLQNPVAVVNRPAADGLVLNVRPNNTQLANYQHAVAVVARLAVVVARPTSLVVAGPAIIAKPALVVARATHKVFLVITLGPPKVIANIAAAVRHALLLNISPGPPSRRILGLAIVNLQHNMWSYRSTCKQTCDNEVTCGSYPTCIDTCGNKSTCPDTCKDTCGLKTCDPSYSTCGASTCGSLPTCDSPTCRMGDICLLPSCMETCNKPTCQPHVITNLHAAIINPAHSLVLSHVEIILRESNGWHDHVADVLFNIIIFM